MDSKQLDLELSHSAKLNPTAEVSSKSTGPESPSMRTSSNSQPTDSEQMGLFQTSSAAATHASRSQSQDLDEAKRMIDISGRSLFPLLRDSDPLGAFSKMCMGTSLWGSTTYSMTWKAKATPRGRLFLVLSPSTRSTAGLESSSSQETWPTPTQDSASDRTKEYAQGGMPLTVAVKLWPTPTVQDSNKATKRWREDHQNNLTAAVFNPHKMFPTPTSRDSKGGYRTESLIRKDGKSRAMEALSNAVLDGKGTETASGHLNPEWVEWLMGYKIGHTELKGWATRSFRKSSRKSEKS